MARVNRFKSRPKYEPIVIKEELTPAELAFVEAHRDPEFFPEMEVFHAQKRLYPQNELAAHLVGYTGEISEKELDQPEFAKYEQGDIIGKAGIERQYNDILRGVDGQRRVVVDNRGHVREATDMKDAKPGKNLQLTIDLDLQVVAELAMEDKKGRGGGARSAHRRDPGDGQPARPTIRTSSPCGSSRRIGKRPDVESGQSPAEPGDSGATRAGIDIQAADGDRRPGNRRGRRLLYRALRRRGQLLRSLSQVPRHARRRFAAPRHRAILRRLLLQRRQPDGDRQDRFLRRGGRLRLARPASICRNEAEGIVPSTKWKIRTFRQKWYPGETISVSIGQGALTVTPLQLAHAIGGIAMGGVWYKPHLVKGHHEPPREWALDPSNVQKVVDGMYSVVNGGGTGARARLPGIEVCGKTGTAQLASNDVPERPQTDPGHEGQRMVCRLRAAKQSGDRGGGAV